MSLRNDYVLGEELPADDMNDIVDAILTNQHNILELYLENYYGSLFTPSLGLFFDGFSDNTKIDDREEAITSPASSGQPDVEVADGSVFFPNEEVDIYDTTSGNFETRVIDSILGDVITFTANLTFSYTTAGFVSRSSVDLNTGPRTITVKTGLVKGNYRGNKVTFQQGVSGMRVYVMRKNVDALNRFPIGASVVATDEDITIAGDVTPFFLNGDTIDIYNATNTVRERKTLTASPSFGAGFTTLTFTGQPLANGFATTGFIDRVDILPMVSLVDDGADEDFQNTTWESSIANFTDDETEDELSYDAGSDKFDYIIKLMLN